ncbi:MAG: DUF2213 domain-containing protein [Terriglobales bacterium]
MNAFYASSIGPHTARTPEGYLLCLATPICRTGSQRYRGSEIGLDDDGMVVVHRPAGEVLSKATIASFESKPICCDHPPRFLDSGNAHIFQKGHVRNVRPGPPLEDGELPLLGDLVITDATLIEQILRGDRRELSAGYSTDYMIDEDGQISQTKIRANHVACVNSGRAGSNVKISDSTEGEDPMTAEEKKQLSELTAAINGLVTAMKDEQRPTTTERRRPAGEMLRDAKRIEQRMATTNEGPAALHQFITSQALRDETQAAGVAFEEQSRRAGVAAQRRWGYEARDCRPSLRRATDATPAQDFEEVTRQRRKELLGR